MQNGIQYIAERHGSKETALANKRKAASLGVYFIADPTFDEIKFLVTHGYTWSRVGEYTQFVSVDIDDSNITHKEMAKIADERTIVTTSASGKEYKHHVFRWLTTPVTPVQYKKAIANLMQEIQTYFPGKYAVADLRAYSFYQCFYGHSTEDSFEPWHGIRTYWTKKGCQPEPYDIERAAFFKFDPTLLPLSVKGMSRLLTYYNKPFTGIEYMTYDIKCKKVNNRLLVCKIPDGHRHNMLSRLVNIASFNAVALKRIGLDFTAAQAANAVCQAIRVTFENGANWVKNNVKNINKYCHIEYDRFMRLSPAEAKALMAPHYKFPRRHRLGIEMPEYIVGSNMQILLDADDAHLEECLLMLAEGELSMAKELYKIYSDKATRLGRIPQKVELLTTYKGRQKIKSYDEILAQAPYEDGVIILPVKYRRNAHFRCFLKEKGHFSIKWK